MPPTQPCSCGPRSPKVKTKTTNRILASRAGWFGLWGYRMYVCMYVFIHKRNEQIYKICIHIYIYTHTCIQICIYIYIYVNTSTYTHTHTHICGTAQNLENGGQRLFASSWARKSSGELSPGSAKLGISSACEGLCPEGPGTRMAGCHNDGPFLGP